MERKELAPSVYLQTVALNKFKTNQVSISFIMPLDARTASYASLLSMVLKTGCAAHPDVISLGRALDELYGAQLHVLVRKKGDNHLITFNIEFLDAAYVPEGDITNRAMELMHQIIFEPKTDKGIFATVDVEREKKNLCDIIDARINDKRLYALRRCGELTAAGQPYEVYECGEKSVVESISAQSLYDFYCEYINKASVEIFTFGQIDANAVITAFAKSFCPQRNPKPLTTTPIASGQMREFEEIYPVEQAKLSMGFAFVRSVDEVAQTLFLILFGASPSSLLFINVREKLSLCYYCSATIEKHKQMMTVYSGVMPKNIKTAKNEIIKQLQAIQQGQFTHNDLAAAKKTYVNNVRSMRDSVGQTEDYMLGQTLLGRTYNPENLLHRIQTVSAEDIQHVAQAVEPISVYVLKGEEDYEAI